MIVLSVAGLARVDALPPLGGPGLFETMLAMGDRLPWWPRHRDRLFASARRLGLTRPASEEALVASRDQLLGALPWPRSRVRLLWRAGAPGWEWHAAAYEAPSEPWKGLVVEGHPGPRHGKTLERDAFDAARRTANEAGCDEALMRDAAGRLIEGSVSTLFAVEPTGRIVTPPVAWGALDGIARAWAIAWLRSAGAEVHEGAIALAEAREAFLTNALMGAIALEVPALGLTPCPDGWTRMLARQHRAELTSR